MGLSTWLKPASLEALAFALANQGFDEWDYSEIAQALRIVFPHQFATTMSRTIASMLTRPEASAFQHAGRNGIWQLRTIGDPDSQAAVTALLQTQDLPLPATAIHQKLERNLPLGTVEALLARAADFKNYGGAIFGLTGKKYPPVTPEATWLRNLIGTEGKMLADQVDELAIKEGFNPDRLKGAVTLTTDLRYIRPAAHAASYQHEAYFFAAAIQRLACQPHYRPATS